MKVAVISEIACAEAREAIVKDQLTALYEKRDALIAEEQRSSLGDDGDDEGEDEDEDGHGHGHGHRNRED